MTPLYDSQEFYKKMLDLQERLRKSEDERMKLEERFNLLSEDSRSRREACINKLRMRYIDYLEEQRLRDQRNHQILGALDKIDGSLARMTARTDRLGILRKQYEAYLLRVYANRSAGGGTGDSGVGSHNEDRSPKTNISQTGRNPSLTQRGVTQDAGNPSSFIPQTYYPQSYIGASNISQFNVPKYIPGQETSQVHVMQAHGQGDGSTIAQPNRMPQLFHGSQNLNLPNTSASESQPMPNSSQEFITADRNYPQLLSANNLLRSNSQLNRNNARSPNYQRHDISNQYLQGPGSRYAGDSSMMRGRNVADTTEISSADLQSFPGLRTDMVNARTAPDFSTDLTNDAFGPYRHSTPLPGYLDYSSRYSRDQPVQQPDASLHYGFTRSDLERVIQRNEPILPKDYLHNPETVKPAMSTAKPSSLLGADKQQTSDAKLVSSRMNDDDLDHYINRIRSLHRDNDQSLEALDIEQNTSGDLLNATLSDDGLEQFTLHSDDKVKPYKTQLLSEDAKGVLALADDFVAETGNFLNNDILKDREIAPKSVVSAKIYSDDGIAKPTFANSNDTPPAMLKSNVTSGNLSISATRDDILSGTASVDINKVQDTIPTAANGKFRTEITPPISDAAIVSCDNPVGLIGSSPNERAGNELSRFPSQEHIKITESKFNAERKVIDEERASIEVPSSRQSMIKNDGSASGNTEVHEDIEGDKVTLIKGEPSPEQVIDVVKELQPPSLQHYEKNVVEIHVGNGNKKSPHTRNVVTDAAKAADIVRGNGSALNISKTTPPDSIVGQKYSAVEQIEDQSFDGSGEHKNENPQNKDNAGQYPTDENQSGKNLSQTVDENRDTSQEFEQNSEKLYNPDTNEHHDYDIRQTALEPHHLEQPIMTSADEPHAPDQIYGTNQQYETDPSQQYAHESNPQFMYDSNQHFEGDPAEQYASESNEHYGADSNEQYTADPNAQYAIDPNEQYNNATNPDDQYTSDQNEKYANDPNEQYNTDTNEQYVTDPNAQYATADPNKQYPSDSHENYAIDPAQQYPDDSNEHYATVPNQEYTADPNEQYGYYQDQPYQNDPNAGYENSGNDQYGYGADQGYEHDPNQYEHDPNQQYEHDPNQQYEHDPNQGYEHDPNQQYEDEPNASSIQDPNQQYAAEEEYQQDHGYQPVGYEGSQQGGNEMQFENEPDQNYAGDNPELQSSNQDYPTSADDEQNVVQVAAGIPHVGGLSGPEEVGANESSAEGKKKNKDVIRALLESDTESTIERNPSNNTESDFDFN